jgi:hypothetical protein
MWFSAEEEFLRVKYGIERISKERIEKMMKTPPGDKTMTRIPFYDMLANQKYRFRFGYVSVASDSKQAEIIKNDYDEDDRSRIITAQDCSSSDTSSEDERENVGGGADDSLLMMMKKIGKTQTKVM